MRPSQPIALLVCVSLLAACAEPGRPGTGIMHGGGLTKEDVGTAAGAIAGGVIGYQFGGGAGQAIATAGGALLGGLLGRAIGQSLDNADRAAYDLASQRAMDTGRAQSWRNPDTGHHGTVTPQKRYTDSAGRTCREYTQTIYIDNKAHQGHGTACQLTDGSWAVVN